MSQDTNSKIFKYNDVEIEFDLSDADILEKYENIFDEMGEKEKNNRSATKVSLRQTYCLSDGKARL